MNLHVHPDQVTWHAVTRFCQRVLDVAPLPKTLDPYTEAQRHAAALGMDADKVKTLMLTDKVKAEILLGRDRIKTDICTFIVASGCIVTVIEGGAYWKTKSRLKIKSSKEHRHEIHKASRRK